jgi:hypothetical protein
MMCIGIVTLFRVPLGCPTQQYTRFLIKFLGLLVIIVSMTLAIGLHRISKQFVICN